MPALTLLPPLLPSHNWRAVTGQPARHVVCPGDYDHASLGRDPEWTHLALDNNAKGAFDHDWAHWRGGWQGEGGSLGPSLALHPEALTWEAWVRKTGFDLLEPGCRAGMQPCPVEWDVGSGGLASHAAGAGGRA